MRRTLVSLCVAAAVLAAGCSQAGMVSKLPLIGKADPATQITKVFGPAESKLQAGSGFVVVSPNAGGKREIAYVDQSGGTWQLKGQRTAVDGAANVAVDGSLVVVKTLKDNAPQYDAYTIGANGLTETSYYEAKAPDPAVKTGHFLLVNKGLNVLYHYQDGKLVKAYRVATGRQTQGPAATWDDYKTNFFTPEGTFQVTNFVENPPFNALKPGDTSYAGGDPENPLGTRWMGFGVLQGDSAWLWGIHGTSHPEQIGTWASDGCVRMYVKDAEELFSQIKGTNPTLQIVSKF